MATTDWYWENPLYLKAPSQIFQPSMGKAQALYLHPSFGFVWHVIIQISDPDPMNNAVGWVYADDNDLEPDSDTTSVYEPPLTGIPAHQTRGGISEPYLKQVQVTYPCKLTKRTPLPNGIPSFGRLNLFTGYQFNETGGYRWNELQNSINIEIMRTAVETLHAVVPAKLPCQTKTKPFVSHAELFDTKWITGVRIKIVKEPKSTTKTTGLPIYYQSGYIAFGHK